MVHPLSYNILSFHCPNYKQMGKWQVLFYGVVKRPVSSEFKFSLLKKPWPVPGLGICNKQSYFSCPVTVSMPWGCVPGTHEKIIPCECSPAGCGCPCLHCIAVTLQMKNRQLRVAREKSPWLSLSTWHPPSHLGCQNADVQNVSTGSYCCLITGDKYSLGKACWERLPTAMRERENLE